MNDHLRQLREALLDLTGLLNRPQQDEALLSAAGVDLDRALFPLLARIERRGPLGVVELADLAGRDYTTVSRQVAKLEDLGLVSRRPGGDKRVREAVVTPQGREVTDAIDAAREVMLTRVFAEWSEDDIGTLVRLLRRLADSALSRAAPKQPPAAF